MASTLFIFCKNVIFFLKPSKEIEITTSKITTTFLTMSAATAMTATSARSVAAEKGTAAAATAGTEGTAAATAGTEGTAALGTSATSAGSTMKSDLSRGEKKINRASQCTRYYEREYGVPPDGMKWVVGRRIHSSD